jgi:hypothetical protein
MYNGGSGCLTRLYFSAGLCKKMINFARLAVIRLILSARVFFLHGVHDLMMISLVPLATRK